MSNVPAPKSSAAMRYLFLFLLGLVVGVIGVVMAMRALEARKTAADYFPQSVMHVMDSHMDMLQDNAKANRCSATDTLPHLQTLRMMANDIEPAFGDLREDVRFAKHASELRAALDGTPSPALRSIAKVSARRSSTSAKPARPAIRISATEVCVVVALQPDASSRGGALGPNRGHDSSLART